MIGNLKNNQIIRNFITIIAVVVSALLQAYVIQSFIRPANLLSSGFTGLAILIEKITSLYGFNISASLGMMILNIPTAIICSRNISVRFTIFSIIQVILSSLFLKVCSFPILFNDIVLNVTFGGFLYGMCVVIALKGSASTGGTDFIALYVSNKTGKSIWEYVFAGNVFILCIFGYMFGWNYAGYSILFQYVSTKVISVFHNRYKMVTLQVTTEQALKIMELYTKEYRHGISCVDAIGGYSHKKMYLLHTVVSSYEVNDIIKLMSQVDPRVIVNIIRTESFYGGFYREPI